jgi:hypothetical protein
MHRGCSFSGPLDPNLQDWLRSRKLPARRVRGPRGRRAFRRQRGLRTTGGTPADEVNLGRRREHPVSVRALPCCGNAVGNRLRSG